MTRIVSHVIGGKLVAGESRRSADVFAPDTGEVQAAIADAAAAQPGWAAQNPQRRARVPASSFRP